MYERPQNDVFTLSFKFSIKTTSKCKLFCKEITYMECKRFPIF